MESIKDFMVGQKQENWQREETNYGIDALFDFPEFLGEVG